MKSGKPIYYWDTCVFLAWIKDEARPNKEMEGVNYIAGQLFRNSAILATSTLIQVEILKCTLDKYEIERFNSLFKQRNFQQISQDPRVMRLSNEIREYYQRQHAIDSGKTVSTPDAIHLASAILYDVTEFHTFDGKRKRALLPLNGNVAGYNLRICKPPLPAQQKLFP
jgi:predicted nucleic acid-binding protein